MGRAGEKIHGPVAFQGIAQFPQSSDIPGHSGRLAAYHHNAGGGQTDDGLQCCAVAALTGRIQNNDIGPLSTRRQNLCGLSGIGTDKFSMADAGFEGVLPGVLHRAFHYHDAH